MTWLFVGAVFGTLVLSAFFSGSETAFLSVRPYRLLASGRAGKSARRVRRIASHPERFLGAILTGNMFVNALFGVLVTLAFTASAVTAEGRAIGAFWATIASATGLLVAGEMAPKSIAARHPERWALVVLRPVRAVLRLFGPVSTALAWLVGHMLRVCGIPRGGRERALGAAEIGALLRASGRDEQTLLLRRLVDAPGRPLREVMTPRRKIRAVPADAGLDEVVRRFREHGHTRMPVYREGLDGVSGILDVRRVLEAVAARAPFDLESHLAPAVFCPDTATVFQALAEMQAQSCRMLIVVDEHGGVEGLVTSRTLSDAAFARGLAPGELLPDGTTVLDGSLTIAEVNRESGLAALGIEIPTGEDYDTVAGFVLERLGRIPAVGETFRTDGLRIRIEAVEHHRITRVRVLAPSPARAAEAAAPAPP